MEATLPYARQTGFYSSRTIEAVASGLFVVLLGTCILWKAPIIIRSQAVSVETSVDVGGDTLKQLFFVVMFLLSAATAALSGSSRALLRVPLVFVPVLLWCWASVIWSIQPSISFRRVVYSTVVVLSLAYLVQALPYRRCIDLLMATLCGILFLDWISIAVVPFAIHQAAEVTDAALTDSGLVGSWRGLHQEKNEAGAFCALALIVILHEAVRMRSTVSGIALSALAAGFLYMTQSKTSGGFVLVALALGLGSSFVFRHPPLRVLTVLAVSLGLLWGAANSVALTDYMIRTLDDPASFTGRVQIWTVVANFISEHMMLGSGYGSFWGLGDYSPLYKYGAGWVIKMYEAHNGYLDLTAQLGLLGLAVVLLCLVGLPLYKLGCVSLPAGTSRSLLCAIIAFELLHNLLESTFMDRGNPSWVIAVVAYSLLFRCEAGGVAHAGPYARGRTERHEA